MECYNLRKGDFENLKEVGIIDPTKVTRNALQNALSVAKTILLTEAVVYQEPTEDKPADPAMGMGGMF